MDCEIVMQRQRWVRLSGWVGWASCCLGGHWRSCLNNRLMPSSRLGSWSMPPVLAGLHGRWLRHLTRGSRQPPALVRRSSL